MNSDKFKETYNLSRNGTDRYHTVNPFVRRFVVSDGVYELAELGCYWLMDILATEPAPKLRIGDMGIVTVKVGDSKAKLSMKLADNDPPVWKKSVDYTDMPEGEWKFIISNDGEHTVCCLLTEY